MTYKNYLSGLRVSDGWADHVARGSLGGIDYATGVGTPIPAPTDGRVENIPNNGSAGNTVTLWHPDGSRDQFLHLSKFVAPGNYRAGDTIGFSGGKAGAPGSGSSTGPHIHWHLVLANGVRVNPLNYLDNVSAPTLTGWAGLQAWLKRHYGYIGNIDGAPGKLTWSSLQRFLNQFWGYRGVLDGIPGPLTWRSTQTWLKKEHGYTGVCDGIPGPLTQAALVRAGTALANK